MKPFLSLMVHNLNSSGMTQYYHYLQAIFEANRYFMAMLMAEKDHTPQTQETSYSSLSPID
ncbi:hypothetical protein HRE53_04565 [Acaryochloris sp. 'Moss Beach']|uniref:hypothetical protein n=2 Tax=Acaryochloris TaxID=155977 RepID=UPI001F43A2FE|nr:hypothetical protein [Acaryochloris sp. 'Moss Beach']UJB70389.1 hypothetical protein HRE53_04565 [Acaryochloris sp. 'Moss Beach']